jgi:hypothetical protein
MSSAIGYLRFPCPLLPRSRLAFQRPLFLLGIGLAFRPIAFGLLIRNQTFAAVLFAANAVRTGLDAVGTAINAHNDNLPAAVARLTAHQPPEKVGRPLSPWFKTTGRGIGLGAALPAGI